MNNSPIKFATVWNFAVIYLSFPVFLFLGCWLRFPYNIGTISLLVIWLINYLKNNSDVFSTKFTRKLWATVFSFMLLSILLAIASGAGGYIFQRGDWTKHNVVLNDLINFKWPVNYGPSAYVEDTTLVYYLAYYLPAALIGKLGGWKIAEIASFIYTFIGIWIFCLLLRKTTRIGLRGLIIFFLFSGLDILGWLLLRQIPISFAHLETYALGLQFPSQISQLIWAPQHTLSAWIFAVLMYKEYQNNTLRNSTLIHFSMALIWSPFIAFGILFLFAPFIVLEICRQFRQDVFDKTATNTFGQYINRVNLWKFVKKNKISIVNTITGIIISAFTILYFKSKLPVLKDQIDFYWQLYPISSESIIRMVVFLFVDLFVFIPLIFSKQIHLENKEKRLALWAFILLVFIAQFHYGASNDWIIRVSMPALITLAFLIASKYKQLLQNKTWIRYFFITIVLLGSITPLSQALLLNQISNPATNEQPNQNMLNAHLKYGVIHQQYMGSASRLFGKWFGNYGVVENNNK